MKHLKIILLTVIFATGIAAVNYHTDRYFDIVKNIEIFSNVYKELNSNYVDDLEPSQLMKTAIDAMVNSLDPYTNYISESQIESYRITSEGSYNGLGAQSRMIDGHITITEIYDGGSAMESGLKVGDEIIAINGNSTQGRSNEDVIEFLRGFPGSKVELTVNRPGLGKHILEIKRGEVNIPNVPYSAEVADGIGYIALTTFTPNAGQNVSDALKKLNRANRELKGVILDLRDNGGGLLMEAVNVSNVFIPRGKEIVTIKGKIKGNDRSFETRNDPVDLEIPLVVLINSRSASASEIVSGVIQDYDRGVLLGQRSYGKGLVQNTLEVGYNSRLKITTSKYYIPSGRCIQSMEYENGEPKDIPDNQRAVFYTMKGRPVLDGGGVAPDHKLEKAEKPGILQALQNDDWIFKYVTQYVMGRDSIESIEAFAFEDYDNFKEYLKTNGFTFKYKTEKELEKLTDIAEEEEFETDISEQIERVRKVVMNLKEDDLDQFEELIRNQIEMEIISRYYYQEGKVRQRLKGDPYIVAASRILENKKEYNRLLEAP